MDPILGQIIAFAGTFAPRGWAMCNGQLLSIPQNTALFSILGTTYGGNGSTTFALPNLNGRTIVGAGQLAGGGTYVPGQAAGTENVTMLASQMPTHTHTLNGIGAAGTAPSPAGNFSGVTVDSSGQPLNSYVASGGGTPVAMAGGTVSVAGGSQPVSIVQPYVCINYIIAIQGVFPSRN